MTRDNEQQNKPETTMIHNEKSPASRQAMAESLKIANKN